MNRFHSICNENNLYYIIAFGTLLGSVRHKGLIPWDDDIDLIMYFKDLDKIKKVLSEFSEKYGYKIFHEWKLSRIYVNEEIFIDIFYVQDINNTIVRCSYDSKSNINNLNDVGLCVVPDRGQEWWHKWFNFPSDYILERKLYNFEKYQFYGPIEYDKLLTFWYGSDYMYKCKTHYLRNHSEIIKQYDLKCYYEGK
jgi:phosphorylcholine metabolism protein LicD